MSYFHDFSDKIPIIVIYLVSFLKSFLRSLCFVLGRFRSLTQSFFRNCAGFLLLFDTTNKQSFFNVRCWLEQIKFSSESEDANVLLVGNKVDLVDERVVQTEDAKIFAKQFRLPYVETSVLTGVNIAEAVHKLLERTLKAINKSPSHLHGSVYNLVPSPGSDLLVGGPIANGDKSTFSTCCNI